MTVERTVNFLKGILRSAGEDACELIYERQRVGVTRFAQDRVTQSCETEHRWLTVRVLLDGRQGTFATDRFDQDSLAYAVQAARRMARAGGGIAGQPALPCAVRVAARHAYDGRTAQCQPFERAQIVHELIAGKGATACTLAGSVVTAEEVLCVVNSQEVASFEERTRAELNIVAQGADRSGRSYWAGWRLEEAPLGRLLKEALVPIKLGGALAEVSAAPCPVVLDFLAVGSLIGFLGMLGFGAKALIEKRSFLARALGQRVVSPLLTLDDDPSAVVPRAFDFSGVPRRKTRLIDQGVACGVVTDEATARQLQRDNTGHAPHPRSSEGPLPEHLVVSGGAGDVADLCRRTGNGIYVRDLHYVNVVEPVTTTITGTTRHGTRRIVNGELADMVKDLRFQVRILDVLQGLVALGRECRPAEGCIGWAMVPAMACAEFHFTGTAQT